MTESFEKNAPSRGRDNTSPESQRPASTTSRPVRQTKRECNHSAEAANDGYPRPRAERVELKPIR